MPALTRRWIDAVLVIASGATAIAGWPAIGMLVAVLGLVAPLARWLRRDNTIADDFVPAELVPSYREVLDAASLPGVDDGDAIKRANAIVLESAAILGGRPPKGGAQHRFVTGRARVLAD